MVDETAIRRRLIDLSRAANTSDGNSDRTSLGIYAPSEQSGARPEELLDALRLQISYLVFDLEATRRENHYLRQMLESRPDPRGDEEEPDTSD